jgi:hypothetical protein
LFPERLLEVIEPRRIWHIRFYHGKKICRELLFWCCINYSDAMWAEDMVTVGFPGKVTAIIGGRRQVGIYSDFNDAGSS